MQDGTDGFRLRDGSLLSDHLGQYIDEPSVHYHVASGLAGYGPDADESTPTFATLGDALEYARDELSVFIDGAYGDAHNLALHASQYHAAWNLDGRDEMQTEALEHYASAWREIERVEALELLRANLDPRRASAPLYANDAVAYAALQESQAAEFPHDIAPNARLYLWTCAESECEEEDAS